MKIQSTTKVLKTSIILKCCLKIKMYNYLLNSGIYTSTLLQKMYIVYIKHYKIPNINLKGVEAITELKS